MQRLLFAQEQLTPLHLSVALTKPNWAVTIFHYDLKASDHLLIRS